ncbi:MAG TPA: T9SS type A sorting domain-containing protein, partial [Bacteroidales bacterium]|nr:T9SS type A sorting domain-containing protein [Bacteroidales bacterium]
DAGDAPNVTIFPNPCTHEVTVSVENCISSYLQIELFDLLGKKLNEWSFGESSSVFEAQLNIENLPPSVYILKISGSCGVMVFKLEKN